VLSGVDVSLTATVRRDEGVCPACSKPSSRVHSRYRRTLTDAPVAGRRIRIFLTVRRFFCDPECRSKTFVEQVDGLRLTRDVWQLEQRHVQLARAVSAVARAHGAVVIRARAQEVQLAIAGQPDTVDVGF
jgi:transposase